MTTDLLPVSLRPRLSRMVGRDPAQRGRLATPLELLFDLTFVVAFGVTADQTAHVLAEGHVGAALGGFGFAMLCVVWAWVNFTWFASAFDTDDWFYRLTTMVQMMGVVVLALGIPQMFASIDHGTLFDNSVMVAGYVVMRLAMIAQWLRAAAQDPAHRASALLYAVIVGVSQLGWVTLLLVREASAAVFVPILLLTAAADIGGPVLAERVRGGTPWHAHHLAERYSLLTIVALGEGVFGTVASVAALVETAGWTIEAALLVFAGTGLTFTLWWIYFLLPSGAVLTRHRERGQLWSYQHVLIFPAITGMGAGLHLAAYVVAHESHLGVTAAVASVAIPVLAYLLVVFGMYAYLMRVADWTHGAMVLAAAGLLALGVALAASGVPVGICLVVVLAAPVVTVVSYLVFGWRHEEEALRRALA